MRAAFSPRRRARGVSIVELMVSVAISLAVLSTMIYVYLGSRGAYRTNESLARVQETGRFALEFVTRDLREAGYMGCLSRGVTPTVYSRPVPPGATFGMAIYGYENGAGWTNPSTIVRAAGDVVEFSSLLSDSMSLVADRPVVNGNIKIVDNCPGFAQGDILLVANCERAAIFTVSSQPVNQNNCPAGNQETTLAHGANNNGKNGIVDTHLINPPFTAGSRSFVTRLVQSGYFIGLNPTTKRPGLYRYTTNRPVEEIVQDVEDLDVLFGVDADADGAVDTYLRADAVTAAQWPNVLSVRVSLLVVGGERSVTAATQVVFLRDSNNDALPDAQTAADRRLRQVFTSTVALRNRLQ